MKLKKKKISLDTMQEEEDILSYITPLGLEFKRNEMYIGENRARGYGVTKYPQNVPYGWLSKFTNIPSTVACITYTPVNSSEFVKSVASSIKRYRSDANYSTDPLEQQRARRSAEDGEKLIESIDAENQSVGNIGVHIMPLARNDKDFEKACRMTEGRIASNNCSSRILSNVQENMFKSLSPYYTKDDTIDNILQRIMPMKTFLGGFPFSTSGYSDGAESKYIFANDSSGGVVSLDFWKRGDDRTNSNFVITGQPGQGKSTVVKLLIINEYMMGTKIVIIDPDNEYADLCYNLNGDVINAGGGKNGILNPLQVRPSAETFSLDELDDDSVETSGLGDLAMHLQLLDVFFSLYITELTNVQKALLKDLLIEMYGKFNITWDTDVSNLGNNDFPIMKDLYDLALEKMKEDSRYEDLSILLKDCAIGVDSFLFGKHSTINPKSRCTCLNTSGLQNTGDNVKSAQYFNLTTYCWNIMSKDRTEKVMLICDEAYHLINKRIPQALIFLNNTSKRCRKYEAGIAIISHSVEDFLADEVKQYGQALLDNPCYKILMGSDGKNLLDLKKLYNLTEAEESLIESKKRGYAVGVFGKSRLAIRFVIPQHKLDLMGSRGGR